jgi:hypothetical protein
VPIWPSSFRLQPRTGGQKILASPTPNSFGEEREKKVLMNIAFNIARVGGVGDVGRPSKQGISLFVDLRTNPFVALGWWDSIGWDRMNLVARENKWRYNSLFHL